MNKWVVLLMIKQYEGYVTCMVTLALSGTVR
jgi:hypothetical protein